MVARKKNKTDDEIIGMKEALELLDVTQPTFYRWIREGKISGNKVGRQWRFKKADIEGFLRGESPAQKLPSNFDGLISQLEKATQKDVAKENEKEDVVDYAVFLLLQLAIEHCASDIHLEPGQPGRIRYRFDGVLHEIVNIEEECSKTLIKKIKTLAQCNVNINDLPQDGRIQCELMKTKLDIRITFLPTIAGEEAILKLFSSTENFMDLEKVIAQKNHLATIKDSLSKSYGLHICCGPTGSGKTTTLYSMLQSLDHSGNKIITIENPVEYRFPSMTQIQVYPAKGLDMAAAFRSALRGAPNVLFIGEIHDAITAELALKAALTGHIVLTQMHTDDMSSALTRLLDFGVSPYLIADSLGVVVSQRLLRKLCPECSKASSLNGDDLKDVKKWAESSGIKFEDLSKEWKSSEGCDACKGTGYKGRISVNEVGTLKPSIIKSMIKEENREALAQKIQNEGIINLLGESLRFVSEGKTSLSEIKRVILSSR
ncbi:MAG: hypothetical protein COA79_20715 [Planctomycetota bacterium]|nr:MAG: hypothetical protein COA79_20715 [Planctomycetota bacterium]